MPPLDAMTRGKRFVAIDVKNEDGRHVLEKLCSKADVLIEPFRPGVMERLGLGPDHLLKLNKRLIYARLSGYGQKGEWSLRAGHDINYIALSGALSRFASNGKPVPPMNMLADFAGGGMSCALGILMALLERNSSDLGQVVDVSMVEGARYCSTYMWHTQLSPNTKDYIWPQMKDKESNLLDGGAHFYTVYETKDNRWMSVGSIEPQFYERLLKVLNVKDTDFPQFDIDKWPEFKRKFQQIFALKTLEEWAKLFATEDACVEPVLELLEAEKFDKDKLRSHFNADHTPKPAPLLSRTPAEPDLASHRSNGQHTAEVLREAGYTDHEIVELSKSRAVVCDDEAKL